MNKKSTLILLSFGASLIMFLLIFSNQVDAKIIESNPIESIQIERSGTYFEIKDSKYLNITLKSEKKIEVFLESVPKMISLKIRAIENVSSTILTVENLNSNKTYYKYEDGYQNEVVFVSDKKGNYTFTQDLTKSHHIWFQEIQSKIFLPDDCSKYGTWDATTSTCILNQDLNQSIEITKNNITLDCNNHNITGSGTGYGIYLSYKSGVTIRNCIIENFSEGITFYESSNNTVNNNIIKKSTGNHGITLWLSSNNVVSDNTMDFNNFGIAVVGSPNSIIARNSIANSKSSGIQLYASSYSSIIENTLSSNGWGIQLLHSLNNILTGNEVYSNELGIFFSNDSSDNILRNNLLSENQYNIGFDSFDSPQAFVQDIDQSNKINGKPIYYLVGETNKTISGEAGFVGLVNCQDITVKDLFLTNNYEGLLLVSTKNSRIENIKTLDDSIGVLLIDSSNNNFSKNQISSKGEYGIGFLFSSSSVNILTDNDIKLNNYYGIALRSYLNFNNKFYHNNFLDNGTQVYIGGGTGNLFDNGYPSGGNYWSDYIRVDKYSGPGQNELGSDGIGDTPYTFTGGEDRYPFMEENGWIVNQPPALSNLNQYKSDGAIIIDEGQTTTESTVVFKAMVSDPENDQIKLKVELRQMTEPFTGIDDGGILSSDLVDSGTMATITRFSLVNGQYKWRARAIDEKGTVSGDWQEFGAPANMDFEVRTVPLYTQVRSPYPSEIETLGWAIQNYAYADPERGVYYDCGFFIRDCGCAITSEIMILRFHGITTLTDGSDVNPSTINAWHQNNNGYWPNGDVKWEKIDEYSKDPQTGLTRLQYVGPRNFKDITTLDFYLGILHPVILKTIVQLPEDSSPHFVVADGKLATTYTIKDPAWYNTKKLTQAPGSYIYNYNNNFYGLRLFNPTIIPRKGIISMYLASPAELLVTDPLGRKIGKDPIANIEYNEIPDSSYYLEAIGNPFTPTPVQESKNIWIPGPVDGKYNIQVIGTEMGSYTISLSAYDQTGQSKDVIQEGTTVINNIQEFELNYSLQTIQETEFYRIIDIDIKPGSYPNSINCKNQRGIIPVAIFTTNFFDTTTVNPNTIRFGPNSAQEIHRDRNGKAQRHLEDINRDGDLDLVLHFKFGDTGIQCGDQGAMLTGKTFNEFNIKGSDSIRTVQGTEKQTVITKASNLLANLYEALLKIPSRFLELLGI